ncbi:MAG TPA: hypothetical protein PK402_00200 [Tepidisphaeraceae bacterium]|nr:hypothetical protein [Tepidisphaeraceae bacterium]
MAQAGRLLMLLMVSSLLYSDERASTTQPERRPPPNVSATWVERLAQTLRGIKRNVSERSRRIVSRVVSIRPTVSVRISNVVRPRLALLALPPPTLS